jgi:hypothetical protein
MMTLPKMGILAFGLFAFIFFVVSLGMTSNADEDIDISVDEATKQAMYLGINKGYVRVNEEISLNYANTKEALVRSFAEQANFSDGEVKLYIHSFSEQPALLATEAYNTFETPLYKYLSAWDKQSRNSDTTVRHMEVGIFEAKKLTK